MSASYPPSESLDSLLAHRGRLEALARTLVRDGASADDLVQETWLRALTRRPSSGEAGSGWLATIARNLARDAHRRAQRRVARESAAARPESVPSAESLVARAEARRHLIDAVVALDEPYRTVVLMRFFEGLPPRRIAALTGVGAGTVRTRLYRGLALLRGRLDTGKGRAGLLALAGGVPGPGALVEGASVKGLAGGVVMASKGKSAAIVLLFLLLGGVAWRVAAGDAPAAAPIIAPPGSPTTAPRPRATTERAAADAPEAPPPAAAAVSNDLTTAAEPDAAVAPPRRLTVTVLGPVASGSDPGDAPPIDPEEAHDGAERDGLGLGGGAMTIGNGGSRWAPVPVRGPGTWRGRVADADGRPLAGAMMFRIDLDDTGQRASPASFEFATEIGESGADGTFSASKQPDGEFLVTASYHGRMRGPGGLDLDGAARVRSSGPEPVTGIEIRLPFRTARLGGLRGVVVDDDGNPVRSAIVDAGRASARTPRDGRFELLALDPGDCKVNIDAPSFAPYSKSFAVRAGEVREIRVQVTLAQQGTLEVAGHVVDDAGGPLPDLLMFLGDGGEFGRYTDTDAAGRYRFARIADVFGKIPLAVMPVPLGDAGTRYLQERREDVRAPDTACDFVLRRTAPLRLLFRSATDGAPLTQFNLDAQLLLPGEESRQLFSAWQYDDEGAFTLPVPRGRIVMQVEAKGHRGVEVTIDVPNADGPMEAEIVLARE